MQCTCSTRFYIYFSDALVSGVTSRPVDLQINTLDIEIRVSARRSIIVEVRDVPKRRLRRWWPFNDHRGIRTLWSGDYYVGSRYTDKGSWWRCGEFHSCQNALFGISVSDLWSVFYRKMVASLLRVLKLLEMPLHGCKTTMAASSASFLFQQMVVLSHIMGLFFFWTVSSFRVALTIKVGVSLLEYQSCGNETSAAGLSAKSWFYLCSRNLHYVPFHRHVLQWWVYQPFLYVFVLLRPQHSCEQTTKSTVFSSKTATECTLQFFHIVRIASFTCLSVFLPNLNLISTNMYMSAARLVSGYVSELLLRIAGLGGFERASFTRLSQFWTNPQRTGRKGWTMGIFWKWKEWEDL